MSQISEIILNDGKKAHQILFSKITEDTVSQAFITGLDSTKTTQGFSRLCRRRDELPLTKFPYRKIG